MIIQATILSGLSLLMSILLLIRVKNPFGWFTLFPKINAVTLSPYWAIMGAADVVLGSSSCKKNAPDDRIIFCNFIRIKKEVDIERE